MTGALDRVTIFDVSTGWQGWVLLLVTFIAASVATRLGLKRKMLLGIAEERGGRRGAGNAIANTGVAAVAAAIALAGASAEAARLAFAAALVAGGSDTIASEIGKAWGRRTWSITSLTRVPPGTSGAMSLEGTAAGIAGAAGTRRWSPSRSAWLAPRLAAMAIVIGATAGSLLESWLGATLEAPGILNNDMLNFINTAAAAAVAALARRGLDRHEEARTAYSSSAVPSRWSRRRSGFVSGAVTAYGAAPREPWHTDLIVYPAGSAR